jgi:hypothetical protein
VIVAIEPRREMAAYGRVARRPPEYGPAGLGEGGQLLISALRRIALGHGCSVLTRRDFAIAFPGDANEVFATFCAFLQALAHAGRRKLRAGRPGAPRATPDETALLALIAAAQAGDEVLVDAHLCWLARADARPSVAIMTRALATALAAHGQWLRVPALSPSPSHVCGAGPSLLPQAWEAGRGLG